VRTPQMYREARPFYNPQSPLMSSK
jgi:hypothetical protein